MNRGDRTNRRDRRERIFVRLAATIGTVALLSPATGVRAESRPIDVARSRLTIYAYKSGLFSVFADDHVITAPVRSGSISEEAPLSVTLAIRSADLRVLDPGMAADKRSEVQARMLGPEVLDVQKFPEITFTSTSIESAGEDRWTVTGQVTIRDKTRTITFPVSRMKDTYRGQVAIKQSDFGIEPIKVAGGTVRVKDELKMEFEIAR